MVEAAVDGVGIALASERVADAAVRARKLTVVLDAWCPRYPGLCLYYPGHRQVPQKLRAFIDLLKEEVRRRAKNDEA